MPEYAAAHQAQAAHNRARRPNPAHPRKRRWQTLLHHFDLSPFSEKVRLVLGAKGFDWQSVTVPMVLSKPDVVALTGGCRRTPFLQMGADIYCDTALICRVIDALAPHPALYPAHNRGLAEIVAQWADASLFWIAVPFMSQQVSMPYLFPGASEQTIQSLFADRAAMAPHIRRATIADGEAQLQIYLARLDHMLANGGPFLLGEAPCIADFSVVHSLW
jgi:glutathione S-transferase